MPEPLEDPDGRVKDRRRELLDLLRASAQPLTVTDMASALGLKISTIRGHLDVLLATGSVDRTPIPGPGRGRPKWGYRVASAQATPYEMLARALAHHVGDGTTTPAILAEEWLARIPEHSPPSTPDEAVEQAADALDALGFDTRVSPLGDSITMTRCPYADLVESTPLLCDIHGALVRGLLEDSGQGVAVERLDVWARQGTCVIALSRPDITPARTISPEELARVPLASDDRPTRGRTP